MRRALTAEPFEDALPIREFFAWPGKRNYEGLWWSSTRKRHTGFESLLERQYLLNADHDSEVVGISSQPLALLWANGSKDADGRTLRDHVPDFFVRLSNGDGRLVDVRRPDKAEAPSVRTDASPVRRDRLAVRGVHWTRWAGGARPYLAGWIRMDRYAPSPDVARHLIEAFMPATSLKAGVARAARSSGVQKDLVQANALNMLFTGRLSVDLRQPLTMASEVGAVVAVGGPGRSSGAPLSPLPRST